MSITTAKRIVILCSVVMLLSTVGLYNHIAWVKSYYFILMWWPWIALITAYLISHNKELPWKNRKEFILLTFSSIFIWTFFEAYNLVFHNWIYVRIPLDPPLRWLGYSLSFATVLPGLWLAMQLIYPQLKNPEKPRKLFKGWEYLFISIGLLTAITPLIYPTTCFALVWIAFIFLPEPYLYHKGLLSLTREYEQGDDRRLTALLFAGVLTGFLWELWNWKAGGKWIYTLPFLEGKLFEMPFAGFLGFPVFAVEVWVMHQFIAHLFKRIKKNNRYVLVVLFALIVIVIYYGIDSYTVK